jgi:tetratricopeptide (TPR) repeat protein
MDTFGPENFLTLQRHVAEEVKEPTLRLAQSIVRLSNWDPDVFFKFGRIFIEHVPTSNERVQVDVYRDVRRIYSRYFPLQQAKDVAFDLGRVCMGMRKYKEAAALFLASQRQCGEHHVSIYNVGICLFHLGQMKAALACFDRTLAMAKDYTVAVDWKKRCEAKLAEEEKAEEVKRQSSSSSSSPSPSSSSSSSSSSAAAAASDEENAPDSAAVPLLSTASAQGPPGAPAI